MSLNILFFSSSSFSSNSIVRNSFTLFPILTTKVFGPATYEIDFEVVFT